MLLLPVPGYNFEDMGCAGYKMFLSSVHNDEYENMTKYSTKRSHETNQEVEGDTGYELNMLAHRH